MFWFKFDKLINLLSKLKLGFILVMYKPTLCVLKFTYRELKQHCMNLKKGELYTV